MIALIIISCIILFILGVIWVVVSGGNNTPPTNYTNHAARDIHMNRDQFYRKW